MDDITKYVAGEDTTEATVPVRQIIDSQPILNLLPDVMTFEQMKEMNTSLTALQASKLTMVHNKTIIKQKRQKAIKTKRRGKNKAARKARRKNRK